MCFRPLVKIAQRRCVVVVPVPCHLREMDDLSPGGGHASQRETPVLTTYGIDRVRRCEANGLSQLRADKYGHGGVMWVIVVKRAPKES